MSDYENHMFTRRDDAHYAAPRKAADGQTQGRYMKEGALRKYPSSSYIQAEELTAIFVKDAS